MKKRILVMLMAMMMCITSVCLASTNSKLLDLEEKTSELAIQVIAGTTVPDELRPLCEESFAKNNLGITKLNADRKQIKDLIGSVKNAGFIQLLKMSFVDNNTKKSTPIDRVVYVATGSNNRTMICSFDFVVSGKKPMLMNAAFNIPEPTKEATKK